VSETISVASVLDDAMIMGIPLPRQHSTTLLEFPIKRSPRRRNDEENQKKTPNGTHHTTAQQSYISYHNNSTDHRKSLSLHKLAYPLHSRYQNRVDISNPRSFASAEKLGRMKMGEAHSQRLFSSCGLDLRSGLEDLGVALALAG
jgi:hypothetical protein